LCQITAASQQGQNAKKRVAMTRFLKKPLKKQLFKFKLVVKFAIFTLARAIIVGICKIYLTKS